jgi:hypothetical protein
MDSETGKPLAPTVSRIVCRAGESDFAGQKLLYLVNPVLWDDIG